MALSKAQATRRNRRNRKKSERGNNKLWAEGLRETILTPHIPLFADAVRKGWSAQRIYLGQVFDEYHFHVPWDLPVDEEPPPLKPYDPLVYYAEETLTEELAEERHLARKKSNKVCHFLFVAVVVN